MAGLKPCRECKTPIAQMTEICPHCGADAPALGSWTYGWIHAAGLLAVLMLLSLWFFI